MRRLGLFLLAFCSAAACGPKSGDGGDGGGDDGGGTPVPESQYLPKISALICGLVHDTCDCPDPDPATKQQCLDQFETLWDVYSQMAKDAGLSYDAVCAGKNLDFWSDAQCGTLDEVYESSCEGCAIYHGDVQEGQPCADYDIFSDCAAEFYCVDGVCEDLCDGLEPLADGAPCRDADGAELGQCSDASWCDLETGTCVALPGIGEPCPGYDCAAGAICELEAGPEPVCVAAPGIGDPCPDYQCEVGADCDSDTMLCVESEPLVCMVG